MGLSVEDYVSQILQAHQDNTPPHVSAGMMAGGSVLLSTLSTAIQFLVNNPTARQIETQILTALIQRLTAGSTSTPAS